MISPSDASNQTMNMEFNGFKAEETKDEFKMPAKRKSIMQKYLGSNPDLCPMLRVQGIFGITYCGNTPFGKSHSGLKKAGFLVYDSMFILLFILVEAIALTGDNFDRIFRESMNTGIMNWVFKMSSFAVTLEYLVIKTSLLFNGKDLYMSIHAIGALRSFKQMRIVWIYMFAGAIIDSLATTLNFVDFEQSFTEFLQTDRLKFILFIVNGLIHGMAKTSVLSVLLYSSLVIRQQLNDNIVTNSVDSPQKLCQSMLDMRDRIDKINYLTGTMMLVKLGSNSFIMSGCLCSLALKELDPTTYLALTFYLMSSFIDMAVSCHSSQIIIYSMDNLCKAIDNHLSLHPMSEQEYRQYRLIVSLKEYFRYTVLNLFDLKDLTILVIIGNVANYAVILIQTQS